MFQCPLFGEVKKIIKHDASPLSIILEVGIFKGIHPKSQAFLRVLGHLLTYKTPSTTLTQPLNITWRREMPLYTIFCANSEKPPSPDIVNFIVKSLEGTVSGHADGDSFILETNSVMSKDVRKQVLSRGCQIETRFRNNLDPIKLTITS